MRIRVDRDGVAMGDDAEAHDRVVEVPDGATLDQLFRRTAPDVSVVGGSTWICVWNGVPVAVQSSGWRTGRVWDDRYAAPADLPGGTADPTLVHLYRTQVDADWLLAQLRAGEPLDRRTLQARWAPIAADQHERGLRERERATTERLLDARTVALLEGAGARIDLHTDATCRFVLDADALAAPVVESQLSPSPSSWTVTRQVGARQDLAQLPDEAHAQWFARTLGRDVEEVAAAHGLHLPAEASAAERGLEPAPAGGRLGRWARRLLGPATPAPTVPAQAQGRAHAHASSHAPAPAPVTAVPDGAPVPAAPAPVLEPVDLPAPEEIWARWSALAAGLACLGFDDVYWADAAGAHHDDHGGSQAHLVLGPEGGALLYGWDRDRGVMTRDHPPLALLAGAPAWSPFPHLHALAAELTLGWVMWFDPAAGWRRVVDPPGGDRAFADLLAPVLTASGADVELRAVQTEWAEEFPDAPAEEAAAAAARPLLLAAALAGTVDGGVLRALFPDFDAERVDVTAGLAAASRCGVTPGSTPPRAAPRG